MIRTITFTDFVDAFEIRKNSFSYDALRALFEYLEAFEEDTGKQIELDPIGLCCEYTEYACIHDFQEDYGDKFKSIDDIEEETVLIHSTGVSFIIQQF